MTFLYGAFHSRGQLCPQTGPSLGRPPLSSWTAHRGDPRRGRSTPPLEILSTRHPNPLPPKDLSPSPGLPRPPGARREEVDTCFACARSRALRLHKARAGSVDMWSRHPLLGAEAKLQEMNGKPPGRKEPVESGHGRGADPARLSIHLSPMALGTRDAHLSCRSSLVG